MMSISGPVAMIFGKDALGNTTLNGKVIKRKQKHERKFMSPASAQKLGEKVKALDPTESFLVDERAHNHQYLVKINGRDPEFETFEQYATRTMLGF
jgi:hypothetical protein